MTGVNDQPGHEGVLRVLTLDGGGAKGFYTLGVLKEIEAMVGCPLHQKFSLVFGTSTSTACAPVRLGHSRERLTWVGPGTEHTDAPGLDLRE